MMMSEGHSPSLNYLNVGRRCVPHFSYIYIYITLLYLVTFSITSCLLVLTFPHLILQFSLVSHIGRQLTWLCFVLFYHILFSFYLIFYLVSYYFIYLF
jgi:hypothetical protein